uniref:Uncharacterized protein n=1 Tax=viral metagenome TaxID=1070528 RepID=A0A6C0CF07_9ZZZZ
MLDIFLRYLIIGILSAYLLIYGLRPSVPYPETLIDIYEHYWVLLILIVLDIYLLYWDLRIGLLLLLAIIAIIFDMINFTK